MFEYTIYIYIYICRWVHLIFNVLVQIVVGIPLEMIHGCLRTGMVYMSGVLAGTYNKHTCEINVRETNQE
jgi:rhomboid-related protein 1/2/3